VAAVTMVFLLYERDRGCYCPPLLTALAEWNRLAALDQAKDDLRMQVSAFCVQLALDVQDRPHQPSSIKTSDAFLTRSTPHRARCACSRRAPYA
jgi:hypothetical protein